MFCKHCGVEVAEVNAQACASCGGYLIEAAPQPQQGYAPPPMYGHPPYPMHPPQPMQPKYYTAGFVLGILALCIPFYGFILGIIGLPLACISKRKSAIIMNSIGIAFWVLMFILLVVAAVRFGPYMLQYYFELFDFDFWIHTPYFNL